MKINKLNYEAFALEYLEGTLSLEKVEAMEEFLLKHPAIKVELEEMKYFPVLMPKRIPFDNKKQLLKGEASKDKLVWLNPMRWSVAASILLATMCFFFFKQQQVETIVATATPEEVINSNPNESVPTKELAIEREMVVVENQATKETTTVARTMVTNKIPIVANQAQLATVTKEKKAIVNYTNSDQQVVTVSTHEPSAIVAHEKEEDDQLAMSNQSTILEQSAKATTPITTLAARDIVLLDLPKDHTFENTMHDLSVAVNTAIANRPERRSLKRFIGKLPGNGVKISIIPSFFTD